MSWELVNSKERKSPQLGRQGHFIGQGRLPRREGRRDLLAFEASVGLGDHSRWFPEWRGDIDPGWVGWLATCPEQGKHRMTLGDSIPEASTPWPLNKLSSQAHPAPSPAPSSNLCPSPTSPFCPIYVSFPAQPYPHSLGQSQLSPLPTAPHPKSQFFFALHKHILLVPPSAAPPSSHPHPTSHTIPTCPAWSSP